jgi:hypothetical protein
VLVAPWLLAGQGANLAASVWPHAAPKVTVSAYNLWYLLLGGRVHELSSMLYPAGLPFSYRELGIALYGAFILAVLVLARRRPVPVAFLAAVLALGLFNLLTDIHERFLYTALPMLLLAASGAPAPGKSGPRAKSEDKVPCRSWTGERWPVISAWAYAALTLTFAFNLVTIAPLHPALGTNLVAAAGNEPGLVTLKALALACAAFHVAALAALMGVLVLTPPTLERKAV